MPDSVFRGSHTQSPLILIRIPDIIICPLQRQKLKYRKVMQVAQCHIAGMLLCQDLNWGQLEIKAYSFSQWKNFHFSLTNQAGGYHFIKREPFLKTVSSAKTSTWQVGANTYVNYDISSN